MINPIHALALGLLALAVLLWTMTHGGFVLAWKVTLAIGKVVGLAGSILSP
jgi:hypothetical protein